MHTMQELTAARAAKVTAFETLVAKMNADGYEEVVEDKTSYDDLKKEIDGFDAKIDRAKEAIRIRAAAAVEVVVVNPEHRTPAVPKYRSGKLKNFKGPTAEEDAYLSGMFIRATLFGDDKAIDWCKEHGVVISKAQSEGINTAGGFLVPVEMERTIIDLREEYGTFRKECRVYPMASDTLIIPRRASGLIAYFTAENAQITESQKGWDQVQLVAKKIATLTRWSTELDEDAIISIADDLASEIAYAFAILEDSAGWNGTGTGAFGGIVGVRTKIIDGTHTASAVDAASGHDTFAEIDATDLVTVMAKLPKYALRNAKWYVSQAGFAVLFQRLAAAAGGNTMDTLSGKLSFSYLGFPIVIDQTLPTAQTDISDTVMLLFGDLSLACAFGERRGIRIKQSDERYFEFDQLAIQGTERIDINVHDLGDNTTPGPLIALVAE